jgi:hypothetical protein
MYGKKREIKKIKKNGGFTSSNCVPFDLGKVNLPPHYTYVYVFDMHLIFFTNSGPRLRVSRVIPARAYVSGLSQHKNSPKISPLQSGFEPGTSRIGSASVCHYTTSWFVFVLRNYSIYPI